MARSTPLATRLREITSEIRRMLAIVRKAEDALSFGPAVQGMTRVTALRQDLARLKLQAAIEAEDDALQRVRLQRALALADNSHIAASHLAKLEGEMTIELARAEADRVQAELDEVSGDDLVQMIVDGIEEMDAIDARRIADAAKKRLADLGA